MASSSRPRKRLRKATPPWEELPPEITAAILKKLGTVAILRTAVKVCTTWRRVCYDNPSMWRCIKMDDSSGMHYSKLVKMCRRAVDLSRGQLIGISISRFGNNDLLRYISQRSAQLKQLRLDCCDVITTKGVAEAIANLPLLEFLCLFYIDINAEDIETIGRCCPLLKSFRLTSGNCWREVDLDCEALAIAKTMPRLCNLYLRYNSMTNVGLKAILKGCPDLEKLDLRGCHNVGLGVKKLGKYCSERIKDVVVLADSNEDRYEDDDYTILYGYNDIDMFWL